MPLPNTPAPEESNVYRQLSSEDIQSADVDNFDIVRFPVKLDSSSEDELRRINLVGQAANLQSQSGPIAGTMKNEAVNLSAGSNGTFFVPEEGEVWQVLDVAFNKGSGTGTGNYFVVYVDTENSDLEVPIQDSLNNGETAVQINDWPGDAIYHTKRVQVRGRYTVASGSISSVDIRACFIRVR